MSVTSVLADVMVPVLSKTIMLPLPRFSSEVAFLNNIPFLAPLPLPTIMATGVAKPSAQGQEITKTLTALVKDMLHPNPVLIQHINTMSAIDKTAGTNMPDTLSATRAIGALEEEASSTKRII